MNIQTQFSIHYPGEDHLTNETLLVWRLAEKKPFRISSTGNFDISHIDTILNGYSEYSVVSLDQYIDPEDGSTHIKKLVQLEDELFLGFQCVNYGDEVSFPFYSIYYFREDNPKVQEWCNLIGDNKDSLQDTQEERDWSFPSFSAASGLTLDKMSPLPVDWKNFYKYYNTSLKGVSEDWGKFLEENNGTISLIWGKRGTGKTTFTNAILRMVDKDVVYIPGSFLDHLVNNLEAISFFKSISGSIVVVDDIATHFQISSGGHRSSINSLLEMVGGLLKNTLALNLVLIWDTDNSNQKIMDLVMPDYSFEIGPLEPKRANSLSKLLQKNKFWGDSTPVVNVVRGTRDTGPVMGF
jgi:hypothetical protein